MNDNAIFVKAIENDLLKKVKHNKISIEKIALSFNISNHNLIKELTELAIVNIARQIAHTPGLSNYEKYRQIVELYGNQANLSQRTSQSMLLQQYSTPAPISYIASLYVKNQPSHSNYNNLFFEPSAGNGLLTIALNYQDTVVNELDDVRLENLRTQPFAMITRQDATIPFSEYWHRFDGVITNPPFGTLPEAEEYDGFPIKTLDHLMALRALDCMKYSGRAAIIIGGHTDWDDKDRIQAGKNRIFFNYLYSHYDVEDVILIDGHKLYSRQGTSFDVRLILIDGRKPKPEGYAPLKNSLLSEVVADFGRLWQRVFENSKSQIPNSKPQAEPETRNPKPETELEHPKTAERFTETKHIPRTEIITDPLRFQGRQNAFAQETVDKIVREGYDKSQDPIIVWYDQDKKKYIVISGHSRWQASEILYKKGDASLATMPVKVFIGDEHDAVDYAILESNRSATAEGLKSDLKAYKRALASGYNKERLKGLFKPESYLNLLQQFAYLDEKGMFLQHMGESSEVSFPYLRRNAAWVGTIRKLYPQLTNLHEKELFEYLYSTDKGLKLDKGKFFNLVEKKVMTLDFDPEKALNLKNVASSSAYTDPAKERLHEIEAQIKEFERQRSAKEETIVRAKQEGKTEFITKLQAQISEINQAILRKIEERTKVEHEIAKLDQTISFDLFSQAPEPAGPDSKLKLAKAKMLMLKLKFSFSSVSGFKSHKKLSKYTIAKNCTDINDCILAIAEIKEFMKQKDFLVPYYVGLRYGKLLERLDYFKSKQPEKKYSTGIMGTNLNRVEIFKRKPTKENKSIAIIAMIRNSDDNGTWQRSLKFRGCDFHDPIIIRPMDVEEIAEEENSNRLHWFQYTSWEALVQDEMKITKDVDYSKKLYDKALAIDSKLPSYEIIWNNMLEKVKQDNINNGIGEIETGEFGIIYRQFEKQPVKAIKHLRKVQQGECINALYREDIGFIDIVWGENDKNNKGYGLKHIIEKHEKEINLLGFEVENFIPICVQSGIIKPRKERNKIYIKGKMFNIVIKTVWNGKNKILLLSAFDLTEKYENR